MKNLITLGGICLEVHYTYEKGATPPYYEITSIKLPHYPTELIGLLEAVDGLQYIEAQLTLLHMKETQNE